MKTSMETKSNAMICTDRGWLPGTRLQAPFYLRHAESACGARSRVMHVIEITAVGQRQILARLHSIHGHVIEGMVDEQIWDLRQRDWEQV